MRHLGDSSYGLPHTQDADIFLPPDEPHHDPTPAEICGQIARVIAVCLGLGLLARVLMVFIGS